MKKFLSEDEKKEIDIQKDTAIELLIQIVNEQEKESEELKKENLKLKKDLNFLTMEFYHD